MNVRQRRSAQHRLDAALRDGVTHIVLHRADAEYIADVLRDTSPPAPIDEDVLGRAIKRWMAAGLKEGEDLVETLAAHYVAAAKP